MPDAGARRLFLDAANAPMFPESPSVGRIALDGSAAGQRSTTGSRRPARPQAVGPAAVAIQHHLPVGDDRHAKGHRAVARDALGHVQRADHFGYGPRRSRCSRRRCTRTRRSSCSSPRSPPAAASSLCPSSTRAGYPLSPPPPRDPHHARAGAVPAPARVPEFDGRDLSSFSSSSAPARRSAPSSRPRCCAAGPAAWSSSTA